MLDKVKLAPADKWIISKLQSCIREVTTNLNKYELGVAADIVTDFVWDDFCDWYIELSKPALYGEDENKSSSTAEAKKDYALKADGKDVVRNVIDWQKGYGSVVYTITVPTSAYYNFYLEFLPPEVGVNIELGLRIDDAEALLQLHQTSCIF